MRGPQYAIFVSNATPHAAMFRLPPAHTRAARWELPYGCWTCRGGRQVLFNRRYRPIVQRMNRGPAMAANRTEWVEGILSTRWFYDGQVPEAACRQAGLDALAAWGIYQGGRA